MVSLLFRVEWSLLLTPSQSTFKALNVEYDDEIDEEPDNTKEVQIEEALKIYANALKYHSQGQRTLQEAGEAYDELFKSEILTYPESLSEYKRSELYGHTDQETIFEDVPQFEAVALSGESGPSTLPQILHLSHKNRGQYYLDLLESELQQDAESNTPRYRSNASQALEDFVNSLDKDDDDVDLWRRAAKVSDVLGSARIARFCLEGALDGDEQATDDVLGMANVETGMASEDLTILGAKLEDELSIRQTVTKKPLPLAWKKSLKLYPFLPALLPRPETTSVLDVHGEASNVFEVSEPSWSALGQAVLDQIRREDSGSAIPKAGVTWRVTIPNIQDASLKSVTNPASTINGSSEKLDSTMTDTAGPTEPAATEPNDGIEKAAADNSTLQPLSLPVRKRSTDAANLSENADGEKNAAKRPRTRKSLAVDEGQKGIEGTDYDFQIQSSIQADQWLFATMTGIVRKLGVEGFGMPEALRALISSEPVPGAPRQEDLEQLPLRHVVRDFYACIQSWNSSKSRVLNEAPVHAESITASSEAQEIGLVAFLESSNPSRQSVQTSIPPTTLTQLIEQVDNQKCTARDVACLWLKSLLCTAGSAERASYQMHNWDHALKQVVLQMLDILNDELAEEVQCLVDACLDAGNIHTYDLAENNPSITLQNVELAQSIFELNLEVYTAHSNATSRTSEALRSLEKHRLDVWAELAREALNLCLSTFNQEKQEESALEVLKIRHLWASVFHMAKADGTGRDYLIACLEALKRDAIDRGNIIVQLPNNVIVPELSIAAAEREISKLGTMDFFLGIFNREGKAPVDLIEDLEPLLEHSLLPLNDAVEDDATSNTSVTATTSNLTSASQDLLRFFDKANVSLRHLLWQRLRDAYQTIDYAPKVLSINLRIIEILMKAFRSTDYSLKNSEEREVLLLEWLRECSTLLKEILRTTEEHSNPFECIDMPHLRSSIDAVADLWNVLYTVALYDDYSIAGGKGGSNRNPFRFYPLDGFHSASVKFHDMQIETAVLIYKLIREGMHQVPEAFEDSVDDRMVLLRHTHYHWGVRKLCKASDMLYLKYMKDELMILGQPTKQVSDDLAQVLYDLYDLFTFSSTWEKWEHGCDPDYFDKDTALQILPFVMDKAEGLSIKDLLKSDLAKTIEKVNSTLGQIRTSLSATRNRKLLNTYLKSPLRPLELFRSLEGIEEMSAVPIPAEEAIVASKGWYFLRGQMIMSKINAQRSKGTQIPEDDIQSAIGFFLQDLEYDPEHWETWFRLGQAYDALLEQQVLYSAESLNNDQEEIQITQRAAIHAYAAAVSAVMRKPEILEDITTQLAELYSDFGTRIYASSRPPFAMGAFSLHDTSQRHCYKTGAGHHVLNAYSPVDPLTAYRLASNLFTRATKLKPDNWLNHFMLAKCLWKIHIAYDSVVTDHPPTAVQDALMRSIETLPALKRADRQEPILDSIFRAVFIAHKMVLHEDLSEAEASAMITDILKTQNQFELTRTPDPTKFPSWSLYMLDVFRLLRSADKKSWHHRIVNRTAELIYRISDDHQTSAELAKDYLVDQHVYNKAYTITIWKPENERPGRHWVYMTKYASFVAHIFEETNNLEGMEILARRIRKKPNEYYEHVALWEEIVGLHLKVSYLTSLISIQHYTNTPSPSFIAATPACPMASPTSSSSTSRSTTLAPKPSSLTNGPSTHLPPTHSKTSCAKPPNSRN